MTRGCPVCGTRFAPDVNHKGGLLGPPRRYCTIACREEAARGRARLASRLRSKHRRQHAGLIHMHEQETAGQLALGEPLPPIPTMEDA